MRLSRAGDPADPAPTSLPFPPLDVLVLELGARRPGDMRAHLEIARPDVVLVTPVTASYRDDLDGIETMREEIALLCRDAAARGAAVRLCADDPLLAALAAEIPGAATFSAAELAAPEFPPVRRDIVGASGQRALAGAVHAARALGMPDAEIAAWLAQG